MPVLPCLEWVTQLWIQVKLERCFLLWHALKSLVYHLTTSGRMNYLWCQNYSKQAPLPTLVWLMADQSLSRIQPPGKRVTTSSMEISSQGLKCRGMNGEERKRTWWSRSLYLWASPRLELCSLADSTRAPRSLAERASSASQLCWNPTAQAGGFEKSAVDWKGIWDREERAYHLKDSWNSSEKERWRQRQPVMPA